MTEIGVNLAVEGDLDEMVLKHLLSRMPYQVWGCCGKKGIDDLIKKIERYNNAARGSCWIVLLDLDHREKCAPLFVSALLPRRHPNLLLRVAVRQLESWFLADRDGFSRFLGIPAYRLPREPDAIDNPKLEVINLARKSRRRDIKEAIVPGPGSTSRVGKDYNGKLSEFVFRSWDIKAAEKNSPSLNRALRAFENFKPSRAQAGLR